MLWLLKISYQNTKLSLWNALAFMTDNANVNYITVHSIYHLLQKEKHLLVNVNCGAYVVCNMFRYCME